MKQIFSIVLFLALSIDLCAQFTVRSKGFDFAISERSEGVQILPNKIGLYTNIFRANTSQPCLLEIKKEPLELAFYAAMDEMTLGDNSSVTVSIDHAVAGRNGEVFYTTQRAVQSGDKFQHSYYLMKSTSANSSFLEIAEIGAKEKSEKYFQNNELLRNHNGGVYWIGTTRLEPNPRAETNDDIIVISFDNEGDVLWQKVHDGGRHDEVSAAITTKDGGIVIGGKLNDKRGLIKFGNDGRKLWEYQPKNYVSVSKIWETDDGSIIVSGEGGPNSSTRNGNVYLEKVGTDGRLIWEIEYDNPAKSSDDIADLLLDTDGSSYLLIYSKSRKGYSLNLAKFDQKGNFLVEKQMLELKKIPKTYAGLKNLSFLRQIGDAIGVFSESNLKGKTGLFVGIVNHNVNLTYQHILPRNGLSSLDPLEVFSFEDGSFLLVAKDSIAIRSKNKVNCHLFEKD